MDRFLLLQLAAMQCHPMMCNNGAVQMPVGSCVNLVNNTLYLDPCKDKNKPFCDSGTDVSYCTANPIMPDELSYPGEPCTKKKHCKYGECLEGYCQSKKLKESCNLDEECNPGLYCSNNKCVKQLELGATGCKSDYECVNWAACSEGECIQYFSLPANASTSRCYSQFSELCAGGMCWQGLCIDPVQSFNESSLPRKCNSYMDCTSEADNHRVFYSDCMCGMNPEGASYCTLFPGDLIYAHLITVITNWINSEMSDRCNTVRRLSTYCISQFWDKPNSEELFLYYYRTYFYPYLQGNDNCIKDIFTGFYWDTIATITHAKYMVFSSLLIVYLLA